MSPSGFGGFPPEAITFFEGLEADNSKSYWLANKVTYDTAVRGPMEALIASVDRSFPAPEDLPAEPRRPVQQGQEPVQDGHRRASARREGGTHVLRAALGPGPDGGQRLLAHGRRPAGPLPGGGRRRRDRSARSWPSPTRWRGRATSIGAIDALKTAPRGYPKDHPRIELLRRKGLTASQQWPVQRWLHTAKAKDRVEEAWAGCDPLNAWLDAHVGPSELPPDERELQ